jgi:gluconolactonase
MKRFQIPLLLLSSLGLAAVLATASARPKAGYPAVGRIERFDPRLDALVPSGAVLERVADGMDWTEGPVWDVKSGALLFSDVPRNVILQWNEGAGVTERVRASGYSGKEPFAGREPGSNGLVFDSQGRLVTCQHGDRRIVRRETDGSVTVIADRYDGKRLNSPNDLVFKYNGDLYFTDPPFGLPGTFDDPRKELSFQGVYRVTPGGRVILLTRELSAPNGIGFSPDEKTLYVSNSDRQHPVWMAYPVLPDGTLGRGRQFAEASAWVGEEEGVADGLKVDRNGNIFGAGPGGIHVFAPDGTRLGRLETGVKTGNLNWGEDGSVLYIAANHWILRLRTSTKGKGF